MWHVEHHTSYSGPEDTLVGVWWPEAVEVRQTLLDLSQDLHHSDWLAVFLDGHRVATVWAAHGASPAQVRWHFPPSWREMLPESEKHILPEEGAFPS